MSMVPPLSEIPFLAVSALWQGTVAVDGMIYEPSGYHPYKTTVSLRLREFERVAVPGGFRVRLVSDGSGTARPGGSVGHHRPR